MDGVGKQGYWVIRRKGLFLQEGRNTGQKAPRELLLPCAEARPTCGRSPEVFFALTVTSPHGSKSSEQSRGGSMWSRGPASVLICTDFWTRKCRPFQRRWKEHLDCPGASRLGQTAGRGCEGTGGGGTQQAGRSGLASSHGPAWAALATSTQKSFLVPTAQSGLGRVFQLTLWFGITSQ